MGQTDGHYFDADPAAASRPSQVVVRTDHDDFVLTADRATFSPRRLDPGTRFLLDAAPSPPAAGTFLDLGCGYGPIAIALARRSPGATVWAVEVNERARDLCRDNAAALDLDNVHAAAPADVDADTSFDLIWSNPPIRIGKAALHELLRQWLDRLSPSGRAVLVVGRNLGADSLHRWLAERGHPTERLASKRGYRLLQVGARPTSSGEG